MYKTIQNSPIQQKNISLSEYQMVPSALNDFIANVAATDLVLSGNYCDKYKVIYDAIYYRSFLWLPSTSAFLRRLILANTNPSQNDFKILIKILKLSPYCHTLDLSNNDLSKLGLEEIFKIIAETNIETLIIRNVKIKLTFQNLENILTHTTLKTLDITGNTIADNYQFLLLQYFISKRTTEIKIIYDGLTSTVAHSQEHYKMLHNFQEKSLIKEASSSHNSNNSKRSRKEFFDEDINHQIITKHRKKLDNDVPEQIDVKAIQALKDLLSLISANEKELESNIKTMFSTCTQEACNETKSEDDLRYRKDCRQYKFPTADYIFDNRFLHFSINQFKCGYYISEGPDSSEAVERLLTELFRDNCKIKTLVVIGDSNEGEGYYPYFKKEETQSFENFTIKTIEQVQKFPHIYEYELTITRCEGKADSQVPLEKKITIYHVRMRAGKTGLLKDSNDLVFLYQLSLAQPKEILFHCDTGLGYAPMFALSLQLFKEFPTFFTGRIDKIVKKIKKEITQLRLDINLSLFPSVNFILNAINLAIEYAKIYEKNLANQNNIFKPIHPSFSVLKIGLMANQKNQNFLMPLIQSFGFKVIIFDVEMSDSKDNLMPYIQSTAFRIKELYYFGNFQALLIDDEFQEKFADKLLDMLPKELDKILLSSATNNQNPSNCYQIVINDTKKIPRLLKGMTEQVPANKSAMQEIKNSFLCIGPQCSLYDESIFPNTIVIEKYNNYRLLNSKENYQLIPYLIQQEGIKLIMDIPSFEGKDDSIRCKDAPVLMQKAAVDYFIIPTYIDKLTQGLLQHNFDANDNKVMPYSGISAHQLYTLGEAVAEKANYLNQFFEVKIILWPLECSLFFEDSFNKAYTDKFLNGIHNKIKTKSMIYQLPVKMNLFDFLKKLIEQADVKRQYAGFFANNTERCYPSKEIFENTLSTNAKRINP